MPQKYLYIYLQDIKTTPKLVFDLHHGSLPDDRRRYSYTPFDSLQKQAVLDNLKQIDILGFFITISALLDRPMKQGKFYGLFAHAGEKDGRPCIFLDEEKFQNRQGGEFYTFIPLKPFAHDMNTDEIRRDPVLHMRVGRIVAQALLEDTPNEKPLPVEAGKGGE